MDDAFFYTTKINYKTIQLEFLQNIRDYISTEAKPKNGFGRSSYTQTYARFDKEGNVVSRSRFNPYLNLLKSVTKFLNEKNLDVSVVSTMNLLQNVENRWLLNVTSYNSSCRNPTDLWIPLHDYSRKEKLIQLYNGHDKIADISPNTSFAVNGNYKQRYTNTSNNTYQFLIIGFYNEFEDIKSKLQ